MRCRIYDRRPLVCRIYPAEVNPFFAFETDRKACPPEAWAAGATLIADGDPVDAATCALIAEARRRDAEDAPRKRRLCRALGIDVAALAGEGKQRDGTVLRSLGNSFEPKQLCSFSRNDIRRMPIDRNTEWRAQLYK